MNEIQAKIMLEHPELYECDCHLKEDVSSIILNANAELVKITGSIRDLSVVLKNKMRSGECAT